MCNSTATVPRIYVACLAGYNAGHLHGRWIDANQDADSIHEEIQEMLSASPISDAEEWAIHDHEGFCGVSVGEYEDIERIVELAQLIDEHGPAFAAYASHVGIDHTDVDGFQDAFCGHWDSEEAYAEHTVDEGLWGEIPENLTFYIDTEKMARDLFCGDYFSVDGDCGVYVFHNH